MAHTYRKLLWEKHGLLSPVLGAGGKRDEIEDQSLTPQPVPAHLEEEDQLPELRTVCAVHPVSAAAL